MSKTSSTSNRFITNELHTYVRIDSRSVLFYTMRLVSTIVVINLALISCVYSTPISFNESIALPILEHVESHMHNLWANFKNGYGITYNTTKEELERFRIFTGHVKMIVKHNLEHDLGVHTYRLGINKYAILVLICR
jgi:hypothetical protein